MLKNREMLGSELRDKIELYSELTGEDGWSVPVAKVADFISGFEMGKERFRKRGRWILNETDNSITCDKCGCLIWANDISNGEAYYCPNCGADMRED